MTQNRSLIQTMKTSLLTILLSTAAIGLSLPVPAAHAAADPVADLLSMPATSPVTLAPVTSVPAPSVKVQTSETVSVPQTPLSNNPAPVPILEGDPALKSADAAKAAPTAKPTAQSAAEPTKNAEKTAKKQTVPAQTAKISVPEQAAQAKQVKANEELANIFEDPRTSAAATSTANTAMSAQELLSRAYATNPTLKAERERLRIQYENVAQADARRRPLVDVQGNLTGTYADTTPGSHDSFVRKDVGITLVQPVWTGGRLSGYVDQQLTLSDAAIAQYESVGSQVFLNILAAAMDVLRDRATIELQQKNKQVIAKQLDAAQKGFEVGDRTRTDVSQAKARLAGADAGLAAASSAYEAALARFTELTGLDARELEFAPHIASDLPLPQSLEAAIMLAELENPTVLAAHYAAKAAEQGIEVAEADMSPTLSIVGGADHAWDPNANLDRSKGAALGLRASMNLYEGGATTSRIRQAKYNRFEHQNRLEEAGRAAIQRTTTAWNDHRASRAQIASYQAQIEAATIARDGVYKEQEVGLRTVLDTLNAERELLDAQVGLTRAMRDGAVADYSLLAAVGRLTPSRLGVFTKTDEEQVLKSVRSTHNAVVEPQK